MLIELRSVSCHKVRRPQMVGHSTTPSGVQQQRRQSHFIPQIWLLTSVSILHGQDQLRSYEEELNIFTRERHNVV
jgi:hypothetical protein